MGGEEQDVRFWQKVEKTPGCWRWLGSRNADGYGQMARFRHSWRTHRYAWVLATGEEISSLDAICHTCDDPACVRNDDIGTYRVGKMVYERRGHLFKATQISNVADRDAKERGHWATGGAHGTHTHPEKVPRGEQHAAAKLTNEQVAQIKASYTGRYGELTALGRRFNITPQVIAWIVSGKGWKHVAAGAESVLGLMPPIERPNAQGSKHHNAKLTEADVTAIRSRYAAGGVSQRALATAYGVNVASINAIILRRTWTHVP